MARRSPSSRPAWENPLVSRYASEAMLRVVSDDFKYTTWRKLWVALAEAQRALGLAISERQIAALRRRIGDVDYRAAARYERRFRHDVMAHLNAFGDQAPRAKGILHLGATSAYVTDNADLIQAREALGLIEARLLDVMRALRGVVVGMGVGTMPDPLRITLKNISAVGNPLGEAREKRGEWTQGLGVKAFPLPYITGS